MHHHLRDVDLVDEFYFNLLDEIAKKIYTQSPKRAIIESYIKLLEYEGRFIYPFICQICDCQISKNVTFSKGLSSYHPSCFHHNRTFDIAKLENFLLLKNAFFLNDDEVDVIFELII